MTRHPVSESMLQSALEAAPIDIALLDSCGTIIWANRRYRKTAGMSLAEMTGKSCCAIRGMATPAPNCPVLETLATGKGSEKEFVRCAPDGPDADCAHWLSRTAPIRDSDGRISGVILVERDITRRKRAQADVSLMARMLDAAPASITIHDTGGRFHYANQASFAMHGYADAVEFLTVNLHDLDIPESEALLAERFRRIEEEGEARFEVAHHRKDGSTFPLEVHARRIEWKGRPAVLSVATDIAERKRAEQEREKLREQLAHAQKMESVGRLAGGVAHDFNNMLNVILGHAEMALEDLPPGHPMRKNLTAIENAARRSADLTRQLLAFARKQIIAPKALDLNDTIASMLKMLGRLIGENIALDWRPSRTAAAVRIDPAQIDQILANLVVNAKDAIGDKGGKIVIETRIRQFGEDDLDARQDCASGEYVMLSVADDGCGMDDATQARIFEPFFTTKALGQGTGLGLATVYGIVKQNRGFIEVLSAPSQGTTFNIHLPFHSADADRTTSSNAAKPPAAGRETILLVEDEPAILDMTRMMLTRLGYQVIAAPSPGEAVRMAQKHDRVIHLLMTDVVMPEMNGRELADRLAPLFPTLKRLYMSGYPADVIARQTVLEDDVNFLKKPFSIRALADKVRRALDTD